MASVPRSTSRTLIGVGGEQPLGAGVALELQHLRKVSARPQHGIAAACPHAVGTMMARAALGRKRGDQAIEVRAP